MVAAALIGSSAVNAIAAADAAEARRQRARDDLARNFDDELRSLRDVRKRYSCFNCGAPDDGHAACTYCGTARR